MFRFKYHIRQIKHFGPEHVLNALANALPPWLYGYYHSYIFELESTLEERAVKQPFSARFLSKNDKNHLISADISPDLFVRRINRGDMCAAVYKENKVVSFFWGTTGGIYRSAGPVFDTGENGCYLYNAYTQPEERSKGLYQICHNMLQQHYSKIGRPKTYINIDIFNQISIKIHKKIGYRQIGNTYYFSLAGLKICYYKRWPFHKKKFDLYFKLDKSNLKFV